MAKFNVENVYLGRPKYVMKSLGVWLPLDGESLLTKNYRAFMVSLQFIFLIFQVIYIVQVWGDLESVSQASYLLFTQACLCFKVTVFHVNKDALKELLALFNSEISKPLSKEHERILERQAARIKRPLLVFLISSQATCCSWALKPLFDDAGREFPFRMWMPVNPEKAVQYELGYVFQLVTISLSAFMYFGVDSVALSSVFFGCAQIAVIKEKIISTVKPVTNQDRKKSKQCLNRLLDENYESLVQCIKQHQSVLRVTRLVEDAYHTYLLFQLSGSIGLICMSALRILVVDRQSMQFFSIVLYVSVMVIHMFVCCWTGHELTAASEELLVSMYQCPWHGQGIKFKRTLCFAMLRMRRPLVFRAGHYVSLSRQTFVAILRMSYSYFAVLRQTHKE